MDPRKPLADWQYRARTRRRGRLAFVFRDRFWKVVRRVVVVCPAACTIQDLYPSLTLWPDPSRVGPLFCASRDFCFPDHDIAVDCQAITTNNRGNIECVNPSSFLFCPRFRWLAACKILPRAALPALVLVPLSQMRRAVTCLPARLSAALPVRLPAASMWACLPATDIALGHNGLIAKVIRALRPGGLFVLPCLERTA